MNVSNAATRFSDRAEHYKLYRPGYPDAIIDCLQKTIGLNKGFQIADIGSGTGIFSALFLKAGYGVNAIEPNPEMRMAAENKLGAYAGFKSINATAEQTTLRDDSIDLITAASAFHWFRPDEAKQEFGRILKPTGHIVLASNIQKTDTPFSQAYKALKEKYADQSVHQNRLTRERIDEFFYPATVTAHSFAEKQQLDEAGLKGHLLSFSTIPLDDDPRYATMMEELTGMFDLYNKRGVVQIEYESRIYVIPSVKSQTLTRV
jgi:ubiquinone/menaquinone biosynthesis C-methylase UbiE